MYFFPVEAGGRVDQNHVVTVGTSGAAPRSQDSGPAGNQEEVTREKLV